MQETVKKGAAPPNKTVQDPMAGSFFAQEREDEGGAGIGVYIDALFQYKWLILLFVALGFGIGYAKFYLAKPRFQTSALIQLENRSGGYTGSVLGSLREFRPVFTGNVSIPAESVVMESRKVMRTVMEQLNLNILAKPMYFPYVGEAIARHYRGGGGVSKPWFGKGEYAWGGERIDVDSLEVPDGFRGRHFLLVAGDEGSYSLSLGGQPILEGKVGERAEGFLKDRGKLTIFVSYLKARPGTRFRVARLNERSVIAGLQGAFSSSENPRGSGMMRAKVVGDDPQRVTDIANTVVKVYQRHSLEKKSANAEKTLAYLETQLPALNERLRAAEAAYNNYRLENGSLDINRETASVLDGIVETEKQLLSLAQKKEALEQRYTPAHPSPEIATIGRAMERLREKQKSLNLAMQGLPETQQRVLRLKKDVEVNARMHSELLNSVQELRLAKAGTLGSVHLIDEALPPWGPFAPNRNKIIGPYVGGGLFAGVALVFLLLKLRSGIESPEEIEKRLHLPVYGSIPHCDQQVKYAKSLKKKKVQSYIHTMEHLDDHVTESFRSLRTSLHFMLLESSSNVVLITGPRESVGKSFVASNLAAVLAQSNKKVLLIDADMRRGHLNKFLGVQKETGLSEYIAGRADLSAVVKRTDVEGLGFISTGERPPNPSELLMSEAFTKLLETASTTYDYVIVDAPPVLAVADAGIIGMVAGATLLVARAGHHGVPELELTVKRLAQSGVKVRGFVLNDIQYYRGYGYGYGNRYSYRYRYSYKKHSYKYSYKDKA